MKATHAPAIVLCPGMAISTRRWDQFSDRIQDLAPVVQFERPGLGEAQHQPLTPMLLSKEVERCVSSLSNAAPGQKALLVAHSVAGFFAEAMLRYHPTLVAGLILLDSSVEHQARANWPGRRTIWTTLGQAAKRIPLPRSDQVAVAMFEDAMYPTMAFEVATLRTHTELADVPIHVVAAARTISGPLSKKWLKRSRWLADTLAAQHPRGSDGVAFDVICPSGHNVIEDQPAAVEKIVRTTYAQILSGWQQPNTETQ